ncbi:hypothetical protein Ancab_008712 [Ancistrocladus abbreviatus]
MEEAKKLHIVMLPWLAFGHMIPFLELSKNLAQSGHRVSFVCTPRNIRRLPEPPPCLSQLIQFINLPLPSVENLPLDAEATIDVPGDKAGLLAKAYDGLREPIMRLLETSSPDWIISDFSWYWLSPIAAELGIRQAYLSLMNAWTMSFITVPSDSPDPNNWKKPEDMTIPPEWMSFAPSVVFRPHEAKKTFVLAEEDASGVSFKFRLVSTVRGCDVILIRSCMELEGDYLHIFERLQDKPVVPVGLLPPTMVQDQGSNNDGHNNTWHPINDWLNNYDEGSVVYIAFGSEAKPSQEELVELALGLELSQLPFFWALPKMGGLDEHATPLVFPDGFEERIKRRGLIWTSWAPQLRILSHKSIGGFFTHCGWSSLIEGLQYGRPLIMLTFFADQGLNARVMGEKKVGIEIPRDEENGSFTRKSVAKSIRLVVVEEGGKIYREKAKEISGVFGDASLNGQYADKFVGYLINNVGEKK